MVPVTTIVADLIAEGARFRRDPEDGRLIIEARRSTIDTLQHRFANHKTEIITYVTHPHRMSPDGQPWCHFTKGLHCTNNPCLNPNHTQETP